MKNKKQFTLRGLAPIIVSLVLSCSKSGGPDLTYEGSVKIEVIDAVSALQAFNITVTHVEFHRAGAPPDIGWRVVSDQSHTFNLMQLRNGIRVTLTNSRIETADYDKIRLFFGAVTVQKSGGNEVPAELGLSAINGFIMNFSFTITEQQSYQLIFDFDASRSAKEPFANQFVFDPIIRVQPTLQSGSISGLIVPASAAALVTTVVDKDTVSTYADTTASNGSFQLAALPQGIYNIRILPGNPAFQETTIFAVRVHAQIDTSLGEIILH